MPNGYTSKLYDGEQSLRDYLMGIGRGMGFAIMQRDSSADEPVKLVDETTSYHSKALTDSLARLQLLECMDSEEIIINSNQEYNDAYKSWKKYEDEKISLRKRYDNMLEQVNAWNCPEVLHSTKETAIKYFHLLIACPGEMKEQLRSGTWSTVRYARQNNKTIFIIIPNGVLHVEVP